MKANINRAVKHRLHRAATITLCAAEMCAVSAADARPPRSLFERAVESIQDHRSYEVPATGSIEVAFSPNEGSEPLVVNVIDSAKTELRVLSYSFTSARVTASCSGWPWRCSDAAAQSAAPVHSDGLPDHGDRDRMGGVRDRGCFKGAARVLTSGCGRRGGPCAAHSSAVGAPCRADMRIGLQRWTI